MKKEIKKEKDKKKNGLETSAFYKHLKRVLPKGYDPINFIIEK